MRYLFAIFLLTWGSAFAHAQQLGVEEILAKHLNSIGSKEKLSSVQSRMALGTSEFESKLPAKKTGGKAVIVSEPDNLMFLVSLMSEEYPFEKIGIFSDKISLPYVTAGARSPLGSFIQGHEKILSAGLFAGSISARWSALDSQREKGKFQSAGTRKVDGKKAYVLDYFPKGGGAGDFSIKVYFDAESFNHLRTEYRHTNNSGQDKMGTLGGQQGVKLLLSEEFSDYKTVDGLTLPYTYRMKYLTESNAGVYEFVWGLKFAEYRLNQKLAPGFFTFDAK